MMWDAEKAPSPAGGGASLQPLSLRSHGPDVPMAAKPWKTARVDGQISHDNLTP